MHSVDTSLHTFLQKAARDAERVVVFVRVFGLSLLLLRIVLLRYSEILQGTRQHLTAIALMFGGIVASFALYRGIKRAKSVEALLMVSALMDSALAFLIIVQVVAFAGPTYQGIMLQPDVMWFALITVGTGLRLSKPVAFVGSFGALLAVAALVFLDFQWNAQRLEYGVPRIGLVVVILVAGGVLAVGMAGWIRDLVRLGAEEVLRSEQMKAKFGAYVPEAFTDVEAHTALGGERAHVAVLFSDLRGFTTHTENRTPLSVVAELNDYFEVVVAAIEDHNGVVDKYMGDGIMAVFGLPQSTGEDANNAINAALAMHHALVAHNHHRKGNGLPALRQGIGVHFGPVVAGNVGTPNRLQYTVLGDTVNIAARLEGTTKQQDRPVLLSGAVVQKASTEGGFTHPLQQLEDVVLRGRTGQTQVYEMAEAMHWDPSLDTLQPS